MPASRRADSLSSVDVTKDANPVVTAIRHIAENRVSDADELRQPIFGHREYKSIGWTSDEEEGDRLLRRTVGFAVTNHRAIVYYASPTCLSARPKMAGACREPYCYEASHRSLDHPAGACEHRWRDANLHLLRGLEIHRELKL